MSSTGKITVSAPGKLMLLGEHAVVYGHPSIVTSVGQRMYATVEKTDDPVLTITAPDVAVSGYRKPVSLLGTGEIPQGARFIEFALRNLYLAYPFEGGLALTTSSQFSPHFGFGSSSASTVCALQAASELFGLALDKRVLFDLAYKTVLEVQGKASGFDVASAVYGGTLFYVSGGKTIDPLDIPGVPLVVGYSGVKVSTTAMIDMVAQKRREHPETVGRIFSAIESLVVQARQAMLDGDWERVGTYMNFNQDYLRDLGVSTQKLEDMILAAKSAGAYGAKLSGGGGGDCMIALVPEEKRTAVEEAIRNAGGEPVPTVTHTPGVGIETTDNQNEQFVVVDEQDNILGYRSRHECHSNPALIHRSTGVVLMDSSGRILLQKRSRTKDTDPGKWALSSAGHVGKGETYEEAVSREMKEELGISVPVRLKAKFIERTPRETEMAVVFQGVCDGPFVPNSEEVEEVKYFTRGDITRGILSGELPLTAGALEGLKQTGIL